MRITIALKVNCNEHISWEANRQVVLVTSLYVLFFKADMKSYIPLETAAIFFLANLFLKQGISSEYVMVDFICVGKLGLKGAKTENYKMKKFLPIANSHTPDSQV